MAKVILKALNVLSRNKGLIQVWREGKMRKREAAQVVRYILRKLEGSVEGRKKLQKLVYFVDSIHDIKELSFFMGIYGPYSRELDDLVMVEGDSYGISSKLEERGDYVVTIISLAREDKEKEVHLPERLKGAVDEVIDKLGDLSASELELYSSVHYVATTTGERDPSEIWEILRMLKPSKGYSKEDVKRALEFLEKTGFLG
ncbi:MAG: DUF4065 domain-containing protein [Candidatus Korarchaeota archaeon]|nr:DUF4065 domain-containing protein [Candidatus Korarchaeota archaeon]